jgi:hypothetical protein
MRLTWLPEVLRNAGLEVIEVDGWQGRGRSFSRPIAGIVHHHTATPATAKGDYPSLGVVRDGRSDLPGPLAQLGLGRSGTVYVIAAGIANHAGVGHWPGILGNSDTIGIEAEHPGTTSHPWPTVQLAAWYRLAAALSDHLGLPTDRNIGHKEWAPGRKVDPIGLDMHAFRRAVDAIREEPDDMKPPDWAVEATQWHIDRGIYTQWKRVEDVDESYDFHRQTTYRYRFFTKVIEPALRNAGGGSVYGTVVKLEKP